MAMPPNLNCPRTFGSKGATFREMRVSRCTHYRRKVLGAEQVAAWVKEGHDRSDNLVTIVTFISSCHRGHC
jgi:hypothetical protein